MGRLCLVLTCLLPCLGVQAIRVKRSDCRTVMNRYNECIRRSYVDYQNAYSQGEDGRPDWQARKTCNYITASIGECPSQLLTGGCKTQEEVTTMKDALIGETLKRVKETVDHWESTKCPAVRSYMQRTGWSHCLVVVNLKDRTVTVLWTQSLHR